MTTFKNFVSLLILVLMMPVMVMAQDNKTADAGIRADDIFVSKDILVPGDQIRLYARVNNLGSQDITGFVSFYYQGERIATPQFISIYQKPEEVFVDWIVPKEDFLVTAKISETYPEDQNPTNNEATARFSVDPDTDSDGTTDYYDSDDDGDGISDNQEIENGTDPKKFDTDSDGVSDAEDIFPNDSNEWLDTDSDGTGDNQDSDDDNDGLYDFEEEKLGTNPRLYDTDRDGVSDKQDAFPRDPNRQKLPSSTLTEAEAPAIDSEVWTRREDKESEIKREENKKAEDEWQLEKEGNKKGKILGSEIQEPISTSQNPQADLLRPNNLSMWIFILVVVAVGTIIIFKKRE
jgi:hypothetical protein